MNAYLREHPEICMANIKEVHYFDNEEHFANGRPDYSEYHSFFSPNETHKVLGEATPIYMYWERAPKRIWEYNPEMKIIILLRSPIDRAYSHWNMERSRDADALSFWDAISREQERCREALPLQHRVYSYMDRGFYLKQLKRIWEFFPREKVLIVKQNDLKRQPDETIGRICEFLQVSKMENIVPKKVHVRAYEQPMSQREREYLRSVFEEEIKELERALNLDCSEWLQE